MINERLKSLNVDRIDLDEARELRALAKLLRAEYESDNGEVPEWLDQSIRSLNREIKLRGQDQLEKRLRQARSRLEAAKTPDERRRDLRKEIKELETQLQEA